MQFILHELGTECAECHSIIQCFHLGSW